MPHSPAPLGVGVQARVPGLDVIGGMHNSIAVSTEDYSLTIDDGNPFVSVTTGNTDRTLDLPACSLTTVSVEYVVQKADSGTGDVILEGRSATVTFTDAGDLVNWTAHGLVDGMAVVFENSGGALPTGLTAGTTYYVTNATTDTFTVALTPGGATVTFTTGSGTHTAYETINGKARWTLTTQYEWLRVIAKAEGWSVSGAGWFTDALRAHSSAGLTLYDDGGNVGLFIKDGAAGRIGIGTTDVEAWDADHHAILESTKEAIIFGSETGGARLEVLINAYRDSGGVKAKTTGAGARFLLDSTGLMHFYSTASVSENVAATPVADFEVDGDGGTTTVLNLGGAAGGSNRDVLIGFATDATLLWDESATAWVWTGPTGAFGISGSGRISPASGTTASAANVEQAGDGSLLRRSTSSLRYKTDVRTLEDDSIIDLLRPIVSKSKCEGDDQAIDRYSFAAEEVHALGLPGLVHYVEEGGKQIPDGVQHPSIIPFAVRRLQKHGARLDSIEARLSALEGRAK